MVLFLFTFRENSMSYNERKLYFKEEFIMKGFVKDYAELCKAAGGFYKKHWKGVVVMNAVIIAGELAWFYKDQIKDAIEEKFHKKGEEGLD